tara:strand:- start:24356 stop:24859 length:504 start_codon:yes stop_codon:yes gene_type:complete
MCMPAQALMLISAGVSAFGQYQQSRAQADAMERQAQIDRRNVEIQNQQLEEDRRVERIRAHDEEMERRQKLNEGMASMRAMNRGRDSGSFLALANADRTRYGFDVAQLRLGSEIASSRIASQIAINKTSVHHAGAGASAVRKAGIIGAGATIIGGVAKYKDTTTPSK